MPTYVCTAAAGRLSASQKARIVNTITTVHSEEGQVPRYLVQVIFHEVGLGQHFINEREVSADQIWIRGDIRHGRSEEQKNKMLSRIVSMASEGCGIDATYFWVYLCDIPKMAEFGSIMPDPGAEKEWVDGLSEEVKRRYHFFG